jgi:hypothetical protein
MTDHLQTIEDALKYAYRPNIGFQAVPREVNQKAHEALLALAAYRKTLAPQEKDDAVSLSKWGMFPVHEPEVQQAKDRFEKLFAPVCHGVSASPWGDIKA